MEIEKKFLIQELPFDISRYPHQTISQGYVSTSPVIRIRQKNTLYFLTCKSKGLMAREEFEVEISKEEFLRLQSKIDHHMIQKERYYIPLGNELQIELDLFEGFLKGLTMAEVEFPSMEAAYAFTPPLWFGKELTEDYRFHNSYLCQLTALGNLLIDI
ncbi:MAG: CYTH domain-containing protein [Vallitaleaceae bacterium]|nr:CYTH domain-containing protein [Vallitaleaceae bacterium]